MSMPSSDGAGDGLSPETGITVWMQESRNVVFSLNVTTALNTLVAGLLTPDDHVLVSGVEHNAVMRTVHLHRIPYSVIPCDKQGRIIVETMPSLVKPRTKALILTSASNVAGTIQPIGRREQ